MDRIKDENGEWKETPAEIQGVIESYFSRLFTTSNLDGRLSYREVVKQVSEKENEELVVEVTIEEVKNDVFSMHPDKAPVSDGLNPVFFQVFWCIVEADVVKFYHNFMNTGVLPDGVNKSLVCLIDLVNYITSVFIAKFVACVFAVYILIFICS